MTPPAFDRVVKTCMAKEPDERWQTASDLCGELKWIAEGGSQIISMTTAAGKGVRSLGRRSLIFGLGTLLLGAAISGIAIWNLKPTPSKPVTRTVINLPPGDRLVGPDQTSIALSPDGKQLAYAALRGGISQLYLRAMDSLESKPIPGTEGASEPFFSPDGQWLGFFTAQKLKKVSVSGGAAVTLGGAVFAMGGSWSSRGTIVFAPTATSPLLQASDAGGAPQPLTHLEKGDAGHGWPEFLPGGKAVLFGAGTTAASSQVAIQSIATGERRNLFGGMKPRYAASGHLIFAQSGTLMAVSFDPQRLEIKGTPVPVVEGVAYSANLASSQYSISDNGSLIYLSGGTQGTQQRLVWVDRKGAEQPLAAPARVYRQPRLSHDGRRVAVTVDEQGSQIWLYDLSRETLTRLTFEGNRNTDAAWTPDGKRIAFESNKEGPQNIFWQLADGSGGLERLTTNDYPHYLLSWSSDGQLLSFVELNPATGRDIWVLRMGDPSASSGQVPSAGSGQVRKVQPFLRTPFDETSPQFSPDGRWLAYISNESGRYEVYVQPYPGPGGKWQISTEGGTEPVWNPNGRELFYRSGNNKMMAVEIATQPGFVAGTPRMLFEGQYAPAPLTFPNYDVSPDGQRFLMLKPVEQAESALTQINVVLNWFEELKQKVPLGKK